ncbi:MAG: methyltransferase domain-containing protein [Parachlamydiaceae bacterium]|nr:methyltransferase domain-containing protein [Parachlamydiaceae bacterium]
MNAKTPFLSYTFVNEFRLQNEFEVSNLFVENKHSILEKIIVQKNRIVHFLSTWVWINDAKICGWAANHKDQKISKIFDNKAIQRKLICNENNLVIPKTTFLQSINESLHFLFEFIKDPVTVGAILPSSTGLAKEIVNQIPKDMKAKPRRILEIGPGTGIFTDKIIHRMNPEDSLDLVEFDVKFCTHLKEKYKHLPKVRVIHRSILDHNVRSDQKYDYIVSGLPLNAFRLDFVKNVFLKINSLTKPYAKLSYFDYALVPSIKRFFSNAVEKANLDGILKTKDNFYLKHQLKTSYILFNAPTARVRHHQL